MGEVEELPKFKDFLPNTGKYKVWVETQFGTFIQCGGLLKRKAAAQSIMDNILSGKRSVPLLGREYVWLVFLVNSKGILSKVEHPLAAMYLMRPN